jgi:guanylate kinase|tara:strand:+ start:989 stop:1555 length:567 start_codon:yes stop_codon:yes gene_type:complete
MAGKVIILCAPSGSGKTTLAKYLLSFKGLNLKFSVSATTRKSRDGEVNGIDYLFLSLIEFKNKINKNEFVEYEEVYPNIFYGTLKSKINSLLKKYNVIFDVDVVGGQSLKKFFTSNSLSIFINPPSINELENRLRKRKNNSDYEINERLYKAKKEMEMKDQFDINIVNENLNISKTKIFKIVNNFIES